MANKNGIISNKAIPQTKQGKCQTTHLIPAQKVSKVSNATWTKMAEKVLNENMGAWKTLAKE